MAELLIERARKLLTWPVASVEKGRQRHEAMFSPKGPDYLPLNFGGSAPEAKEYPEINYLDEWHDPDKMALRQFWGALIVARSGSDGQPQIRFNSGTGTCASVFGLQQELFADKMPWLKQHLTKGELSKLQPVTDVSKVPLMVKAKQVYDFYARHLPELPRYVFDTQSPFDVAHLVFGDDIFIEMHDDPPFVHHLMELATAAYTQCTEFCKRVIGEPQDRAYHLGGYLARAGIRLCEDTPTLLGAADIATFVMPYSNRVMKHFGGGAVHYCGRNDALLDAFIDEAPDCRYLNFGNPEKHDMTAVIRRIVRAGKCYLGPIRREKDETLEAYFRRCLAGLDGRRFGLILAASLSEEERAEPARVMDLYHRLQDDMLK